MKYSVAKTIGLNTDQQAAQTISSQLDEDNGFLAVIDLTCDDAFTRGRSLLAELQDFYLEEDGTPAEKLVKIFDKSKEQLKDTEKFSILLAAVSGKVLYLISQGLVEAFLKRGNSLSPLLNGGDGQLISGFLQPLDRVLFATHGLTSFLKEDFKKSLSLSLPDWEEEITSRIASPSVESDAPTNEGMAGLLIEVGQVLDQEEARVSQIEQNFSSPSEEINIPSSISQNEASLAFPAISNPKRLQKLLWFILKSLRKLSPTNRRGRLILAAILILVLLVGLGFKFKTNQDQEKRVQVESLITQAKDDLASATGLQTLNPAEASTKLDSARQKITQALSIDSKNQSALDLKKQIDEQGGAISNKFEASRFDIFLDLSLIKSGFAVENLSLGSDRMGLLDLTNKTLAVFDMSKKSHQILAGQEKIGNGLKVSMYDGAAFVYSNDKGILRVDSSNQKITPVAAKDQEWGSIVDLYAFAGNVYLLDLGKNQIWKYLPTTDGYSDKREYLQPETKADFSNAVRLQIESSVYVLKSNGQMLRFTKGETDHFAYSGLDKGVKDPKSFYVSSDTEDLYLLDSGNSRLLVLSKTGEFKKQYQGDKFASALDLVVDEEGKKVYLLEGSKIFQVELK